MRLDAFAGDWRVDRVIEDVRAGRAGRFEGRAWFTPDAEGLAYLEQGVLTMEGSGGFAASRRYHWRDGGAGTIEVRFADGRLFHRFYADEPLPGPASGEKPPRSPAVRNLSQFWATRGPIWASSKSSRSRSPAITSITCTCPFQ